MMKGEGRVERTPGGMVEGVREGTGERKRARHVHARAVHRRGMRRVVAEAVVIKGRGERSVERVDDAGLFVARRMGGVVHYMAMEVDVGEGAIIRTSVGTLNVVVGVSGTVVATHDADVRMRGRCALLFGGVEEGRGEGGVRGEGEGMRAEEGIDIRVDLKTTSPVIVEVGGVGLEVLEHFEHDGVEGSKGHQVGHYCGYHCVVPHSLFYK